VLVAGIKETLGAKAEQHSCVSSEQHGGHMATWMVNKKDCEKEKKCNWNWDKQGDWCSYPCTKGFTLGDPNTYITMCNSTNGAGITTLCSPHSQAFNDLM
jgi:hypothetical protein